MDHNVTIMNDEDGEDVSILSNADYGLFTKQEAAFEDPFNVEWEEIRKSEGLSENFRRRAARLEKSFTGKGDAKSKKLDPLDLTGYSLFQIVQTPYNMLYL